VQTVDFLRPFVDDPRTFGEIAAQIPSAILRHGWPAISSLSIVVPEKGDPEILAQILQGDSQNDGGEVHRDRWSSVRNDDVLFGYAVTGVVNPKRVWKNVGARAGDALLFTKPRNRSDFHRDQE